MKVKTFHALTMQDAIRSIKEQLGSDAVILSTKRVRQGGTLFGLFGRSMLEVVAAIEPDRLRAHVRRRGGASSSARATPPRDADFRRALADSYGEVAAREPGAPGPGAEADGEGAAPRWPRADPERGASDAAAPRSRGSDGPATRREPADGAPLDAIGWHRIRQELHDLRDLLVSTAMPEQRAWQAELAPRLVERYYDLVHTGLEPETTRKLLLEVQQRTPPHQLEQEDGVRQALHRAIGRHVLTAGPLLEAPDQKKAVLFIGPTGVGKTTTIAKLAAHYRLKERRRVSLITMDTYRVAAVEQLRTYASVIGVTMEVALTQEEALECLRRRRQADVVLIDTAGRSPAERERTEEVERLATTEHPLEVHLVLSATTRDRDLMEGVARYAGMPINRLLFTKLDETRFVGGAFELMRRTGLPLSYFSVGQRVPEDLEVVTPARMSDLVLAASSRTPWAIRDATGDEDPPASPSARQHGSGQTATEGRGPEWIPRR